MGMRLIVSKMLEKGSELMKVLEQKLQDIAMGKDPAYVPSSVIHPQPLVQVSQIL